MAVFTFNEGRTGKDQQETVVAYEQFIAKGQGAATLRGKWLVDDNDLRTDAKEFLRKLVHDENITLVPGIRYQDPEGEAFVSPLTRARGTGWFIGNLFISVNTIVGLLNNGQLPPVLSVRATPKATKTPVNKIEEIIGKWGDRRALELYAIDSENNIEPIESWIERQIRQMQP